MHEPVKVERWEVHVLTEMVLNLSHFSNGRIPNPQGHPEPPGYGDFCLPDPCRLCPAMKKFCAFF